MRNGFFSLYFLLCKVRVFLIRGCFAAGLGLEHGYGLETFGLVSMVLLKLPGFICKTVHVFFFSGFGDFL
jgi:hypothetical protein